MKDDDHTDYTEGTEIKWKEGKNITKKKVTKTQKHKKTGQKRTVTKEVEEESFFNFFKNTKTTDIKAKEKTEDELSMKDRIELDMEISDSIINEILPFSIEYSLGIQVAQNEDTSDDEGAFDDNEDVDDEDEEMIKQHKKKGGKHPKDEDDESKPKK